MRGERQSVGQAPGCVGEVCVTCSDMAVAVKVVALLDDDLALVSTPDGGAEEVSVAFVTAAAGDTVLVHAGEAIAVVPGAVVPGAVVPGAVVPGAVVPGAVVPG